MNKEVHTLKVNVIEWLEFELAYCDITVQHVNHYAMKTLGRLNRFTEGIKLSMLLSL